MLNSKRAAKSVLIIIIFTVASKLLGFAREALIAAKFGSGAQTDTYFIAFTAVGLFTAIIPAVLNTTMIPILSQIEANRGTEAKKTHTNNVLNIVLVLSLALILLLWILAPVVVRLLAAGFSGDQFTTAVLLMRIGLPSLIFVSIVGVFRGHLQSDHMFTETGASQVPFNISYIVFLIFLAEKFGLRGLMVASVLAVASQIIIQVPGMKKTGYKYKYIFNIKDKYIKKMALLVPPIFVSVSVSQVNVIIDRSLASTLVDGSISALNYANTINGIVGSIFISAIITVIFPILSEEVTKENFQGLKRLMVSGINVILLITIPATIGIIILAQPIVRIAFQRGFFDPVATYMTAGALIFYTLGLVGSSVASLLYNVYFSFQDTKTPMRVGFIGVAINIVFNLILIGPMAHKGLALATSISAVTSSLMLLYLLRKKLGPFGFFRSLKCGLKSLIASAIMGVLVYFLYGWLSGLTSGATLPLFGMLVTTALAGAVIYLAIVYLLKVDELSWIIGIIFYKLKKM